MPNLKIERVVSFSSEDSVHGANNILTGNSALKWKCKNPGEKSAVLVLQLEEASVISGIDIGNENSAYVEVLVGRSGTDDDYKVLLVMSSFMSPLEARQTSNTNKVRMFTTEHLSKPECEQKWDRIKIVCTQPFNRHTQYGLSFIKFYTPVEKRSGRSSPSIGQFSLRPASPNILSPGSLFARRKELQEIEPLKGAAAIRASSSQAISLNISPSICKPKLKRTLNADLNSSKGDDSSNKITTPSRPRNRNDLLYDSDEEKPSEKIDKIIEKKNLETKEKQNLEEKDKKTKKPNEKTKVVTNGRNSLNTNQKESPSVGHRLGGGNKKRKLNEGKDESPRKIKCVNKTKPFEQLLDNVKLVISGIQNPDRGILRGKALEMGALYKPDWVDGCTHLICAFQNTPKFLQVKGKGKIITKKWIEDCYSQRKRLPWRRYALDKNDKDFDESEEEILEQEATTTLHNIANDDDATDDETLEVPSDTEERILQIQAIQNVKKETNVYSLNTDDEDSTPSAQPNGNFKELPDFFINKTFFVDQCFDKRVSKMLNQYIVAYNGIKTDDPLEEIDYFVTTEENCQMIREMKHDAFCVTPDWIWDCHNSKKLVSTSLYNL